MARIIYSRAIDHAMYALSGFTTGSSLPSVVGLNFTSTHDVTLAGGNDLALNAD